MSSLRSRLLLTSVLSLTVVDAVWILVGGGAPRLRQADAFQEATCGVGLGAAVSSSWCFFTLDPRVESICENELWPLPGLTCPNPSHGAVLADFPPFRRVP